MSILMDKTGAPPFPAHFSTHGEEIRLNFCTAAVVSDWQRPTLRSSFWRCYLPLTAGARVFSPEQTWPLRVGEVVVIPPESPVHGDATGPFHLYYAHFGTSLRLRDSRPVMTPVPPGILPAFGEAVAERNDMAFRLVMLRLVASAVSQLPCERFHPDAPDSRLDEAYQLMRQHLGSRLSNAELSLALGMSEASLLRLFRVHANSSPAREHLRMRLRHAATLLQQSRLSIEQISSECGFWDRNHLTRAFTRHWGMPPARYRRSVTSV